MRAVVQNTKAVTNPSKVSKNRERDNSIKEKIKIFSGNANIPLAKDIAEYLGLKLGESVVTRFADGEVRVEIRENVRGKDVFVIQPTCPPVNENLMELLIILDAMKRASPSRINAVIPYYGYARQDRKVEPRAPITAKLVADLITIAGADRVIAMDLHAGQIQGFFNIPVDNLFPAPIFLPYLAEKFKSDEIVIVAPDAGGVERARFYAKKLKTSMVIIDKRRIAPDRPVVMNVIGRVRKKKCIIIDDIIDTAGTSSLAACALVKKGAEEVYIVCTHPLFSGDAIKNLSNEKAKIKRVIVSNTIELNEDVKKWGRVDVIPVTSILGEAIIRIHKSESVSSLFV